MSVDYSAQRRSGLWITATLLLCASAALLAFKLIHWMILGGPPEDGSNLYRVEFFLLIGDLGVLIAAGTLALRRSVIVIPLAAVALGLNVVATVVLDYLAYGATFPDVPASFTIWIPLLGWPSALDAFSSVGLGQFIAWLSTDISIICTLLAIVFSAVAIRRQTRERGPVPASQRTEFV